MNIQDWGSIGELIGAIATVATLIYLAIQVRANTQSQELSSIQYMLDGARDRIIRPGVENPVVANIWARGMATPEDLTPTEKVQFIWILTEHLLQLQNVLNLRKQNALSEFDYQTWLVYTGSVIRTPGGQELWSQISQVVSQDVVQAIDVHLADQPDLPSFIDMYTVMDARRWPAE
ncbi:MAG: hypothetical protein ACI9BW_002149 [Gammaproteobacteria bacterium]|jgi:hypothetical protein